MKYQPLYNLLVTEKAGRMVGWPETKRQKDGGIVIMSWEGRKEGGGVGPPKNKSGVKRD